MDITDFLNVVDNTTTICAMLNSKNQKMDKIAPIHQLLVTKENITEIINKIYIKKKELVNPDIINALRHLCDIVSVEPEKTKKFTRLHAIYLMRKEILENASELYAESNEDELFEESIMELDILMEILKEHTIIR